MEHLALHLGASFRVGTLGTAAHNRTLPESFAQSATNSDLKDYDWSHLAVRYFPSRVDEKCRKDPSLAVAHGCFWKHHPEKAYQWKLRLNNEIGPDFKLEEKTRTRSVRHSSRRTWSALARSRRLKSPSSSARRRSAIRRNSSWMTRPTVPRTTVSTLMTRRSPRD